MKITIHGRNFKDETKPYIQELFDELTSRGIEIQISEPFELFLQKSGIRKQPSALYSSRAQIFEADFFFSIGGDGTLLETVTHIGSRQIPILGINTGRLGFLATTAPEKVIPAIDNLLSGQYSYDDRTLVHLDADRDLFEGLPFGLNEFTITRRDTSSMIKVHTYIDGEYLNSYWADGLIVSTPTGSTGYSLSCGGPVVLPHSSNLIITPVSPHNLNVRPLVVSDSSVISFEIEGRSRYYLVSLDSRSRAVDSTVQLAVRKENFKARLIKMNDENFLYTLRNKMNWGYDVRN